MINRVQQRGLGGSQAVIADVPKLPDASHAVIEPTPSVSEVSDRARLISLLRKRLRRFSGVLATVLGEQSAESVHDLRVWSRRIQQTLTALFPDSRSNRLRAIRRTLRRSRRALSGWRNCDVVLQRLVRNQRRTRNQEKRQAWGLAIAHVRKCRQREIRRARKRLVRPDLFDLADQAEALIKTSGPVRDKPSVSPTISAARAQWLAALTRAMQHREVDTIHRFRIQTKRLRYRIELLRDLGMKDSTASLEWLKSIQEALGTWHDRVELSRFIADALAKPDKLHDEPRLSIILLTELDREKKLAEVDVDQLMREASDSPRRAQFDAWAALHEIPQQAPPELQPQLTTVEPMASAEPLPTKPTLVPTE
ncbi:MAG TPA: CHAD domain-containing protein [Candidatus Binataceae bacterium]|nr:CHAD domain-containing protein [Candidatus Binataceae bacterium]